MAVDTKRLNDLTTEISKELQRYVVIVALKKRQLELRGYL